MDRWTGWFLYMPKTFWGVIITWIVTKEKLGHGHICSLFLLINTTCHMPHKIIILVFVVVWHWHLKLNILATIINPTPCKMPWKQHLPQATKQPFTICHQNHPATWYNTPPLPHTIKIPSFTTCHQTTAFCNMCQNIFCHMPPNITF